MKKNNFPELVEVISDNWMENVGESKNAATILFLSLAYLHRNQMESFQRHIQLYFDIMINDYKTCQRTIEQLIDIYSYDPVKIYQDHFSKYNHLDSLNIFEDLDPKLESQIALDSVNDILKTWNLVYKNYEKLEALIWTYALDFPIPDGIKHTRMPFKQALKLQLDFEKNSYGTEIVAVKNHEYIGSTDITVYPKAEPHKGWTGGLGVLKEYRRRGIATALKIKAIEKLLEKGVVEVRTDNEENNPMYKINVTLGFKPVPFSLDYSLDI